MDDDVSDAPPGIALEEWLPGAGDAAAAMDDRPGISLAGTLDVQETAVLDAVQAHNDPPHLFKRGRELVRIVWVMGQPLIEAFNPASLRGHLQRRFAVTKPTKLKTGEEVDTPANIPVQLAECILGRDDWPLPEILSIIRSPTVSPDGTIVVEDGYSQTLRSYVHLGGFEVPDVPAVPAVADLEEARRVLQDELLGDFPFADLASRAHAVALGLLPFVRPLIDGCTPLHIIGATSEGSGKGLLAEVLSAVATGVEPTIIAPPREDEEWRKQIGATLKDNPTFLVIDNLDWKLNSPSLAATLTSRTFTVRELGRSQNNTLAVQCAWVLTGNNPIVSRELARRSISIALKPREEQPWLRTEFRHKPLRSWSLENRTLLVWAFLVLIQNWIALGRPPGMEPLGSFESWSQIIGGILAVGGIPGFLSDPQAFYQRADAESAQWCAFVEVWWRCHGERQLLTSELHELATKEELLAEVLGDKGPASQKIRLGRALERRVDRIIGGFQIVRGTYHGDQKVNRFGLRSADELAVNEHSADGLRVVDSPYTGSRGAQLPVGENPAGERLAGDLRVVTGSSQNPSTQGETEPHAHAHAHVSEAHGEWTGQLPVTTRAREGQTGTPTGIPGDRDATSQLPVTPQLPVGGEVVEL